MFSFEGFMRINLFLRGVYRIAYLNLLWIAATALGLVVFGIGPASYAVAAYIDRWFRFGETPPVTRAFIGHLRAHYWHSAAMGWILTAAAAIVITNIFAASTWLLQFGNVAALVVICVIAGYVFPVMAATDVRGIPRQLAAALMIGVGSLHWTILAATAVGVTVWLLTSFALPLLVLFGIGIPASAVGFVTRIVFRQLAADAADTATQTSPPRAGATVQARLHLARGTSE
ncbi:YesL family protein [Microbacterium sp. GXF0217]